MKRDKYSALDRAAVYTFLIVLFVITLFPVVYAFLSSLKTNQEILVGGIRILPTKIVWRNYSDAWKIANFRTFTFNSLYMTAFIVVGTMMSATMLGYVFSRATIKGKNLIFAVMVATMFISLGSMTLYPLTRLARVLGINKGLWGVIIIRVLGLNIPCIYLVRNFLETISSEIDQAARIDGCSFFRIYWNIVLPLMQPIVATVGLITFMFAWNDYLLPLVFTLANPNWEPLVVGVARLKSSGGQAASSWNIMMAGTMISIVPMIVVYLILNRYFIAGLTEGSLKG